MGEGLDSLLSHVWVEMLIPDGHCNPALQPLDPEMLMRQLSMRYMGWETLLKFDAPPRTRTHTPSSMNAAALAQAQWRRRLEPPSAGWVEPRDSAGVHSRRVLGEEHPVDVV